MIIETKYDIGDIVVMHADPHKFPWIIIQIVIKPSGVEYCLSSGTQNNWNYDFEFERKNKK